MKHPREHEDYEVEVHKGDNVVVIFKPTGRRYRYLFLASGSLATPPLITRAGDAGDVSDYFLSEVNELADKLASAAVRAST
jgi:hypothetical protein